MRLKFKKVLSKMLHFRDVHSLFHKIIFKRKWKVFSLLPTIVFDHVGKLNDKFSFLIFLTALKGMLLEEKKGERFQDRETSLQLHDPLSQETRSLALCSQMSPCHAPQGGHGSHSGPAAFGKCSHAGEEM